MDPAKHPHLMGVLQKLADPDMEANRREALERLVEHQRQHAAQLKYLNDLVGRLGQEFDEASTAAGVAVHAARAAEAKLGAATDDREAAKRQGRQEEARRRNAVLEAAPTYVLAAREQVDDWVLALEGGSAWRYDAARKAALDRA